MMVEGHKMNLVYYDPYPNTKLEAYLRDYAALLQSHGEEGVTCRRLETIEDVLKEADVKLPSPLTSSSLRVFHDRSSVCIATWTPTRIT